MRILNVGKGWDKQKTVRGRTTVENSGPAFAVVGGLVFDLRTSHVRPTVGELGMFGPSNNRGVHLQLEFDCAFDGCNCVDLLSDVCRDIAARDEHRLAGDLPIFPRAVACEKQAEAGFRQRLIQGGLVRRNQIDR
jgi:hypothetical protein